jgi:hypothetical protein
MPKLILLFLGISFCLHAYSQNLGIGTLTPAAILDVESTDSGILIPRMTTAQRNLIAVDANLDGLMIYNTTDDQFEFYDHGDGWTAIGGGGGTSYWSLNGTNVYTDASRYPRVGINTNNPATSLEIQTQGTDLPLRINNVPVSNAYPWVLTISPTGDIYQRFAFLIISDGRYKRSIRTISSPLSLVSQLRGVSFYYRDDEGTKMEWKTKQHMGVIAQEVENVLPDLVYTDPSGYKAVNYVAFTGLLIEATKSLKVENENLQTELNDLKKQFNSLERRLRQLEGRR